MAKAIKRPKFKRDLTRQALRLLPVGTQEKKGRFKYRVARSTTERYYYCDHCRGWIVGGPDHKLATDGREGMIFICLRCGREIAFHGKENPRSPEGVLE